MSEIHVRGLSDLNKLLQELPVKIEKNILRGALRAGVKVIKDAAVAMAPIGTGKHAGALRDSIRVSTRSQRGVVTATVTAGGKRGGVDVYYAKWVEYGTAPHLISVQEGEKNINLRRSAKLRLVRESMTTVNRRVLKIGNTFVGPTISHPGGRPRPFMRPALDSQAQNAVAAAAVYMRNRLATKHGLDTSGITLEGDE